MVIEDLESEQQHNEVEKKEEESQDALPPQQSTQQSQEDLESEHQHDEVEKREEESQDALPPQQWTQRHQGGAESSQLGSQDTTFWGGQGSDAFSASTRRLHSDNEGEGLLELFYFLFLLLCL